MSRSGSRHRSTPTRMASSPRSPTSRSSAAGDRGRRTGGQVYAVDDVAFSIGEAETLGLVGESGCGKSTVARTVLRLIEPTDGSIRLDGHDVTRLGKTEMRPYRRQMQIIFQDPFSSLNPRMSAGDIVAEPLQVHGIARGQEKESLVGEIFDQVGLRRT